VKRKLSGTETKKEEVKIQTKTWIYLVIFIAILTALVTTETLFLPAAWGTGGINIGPSGGFLVAMPLPYVFAVIMLLLIDRGIVKISKTTFALLYVAVMISTWYSVFKGFYTTPAALFNIRISTAEIHGYALPMFWMPSADAVRGMFYHGSLGNLFVTYASEWAPVIFNYVYWYIIAALFFLGWAVIMRRLWIDVEVLPFPHAQGWLIADSAFQAGPSRFKKYLFIAFALGVLFYVPYMLYSAFTGFPDLYGWLTNPNIDSWATGDLRLTDAFPAIANSIAGPVTFSTDPLKYAFLFLVPMDALFSMWFVHVVYILLAPQILSYFGFYTGIYNTGYWGKWGMVYHGSPLYAEEISTGMALGILVFLIVINWKYFVQTIKIAISDKPPEGEVSYRLGYGLVLLGAIGLVVEFILSKVEPFDAFLGLLVILLQVIVLTRLRAYTAFITFLRGTSFYKPFWGDTMPPAPQFPAGKLFMESHTARWGTGCDTFGPYYSTMMGAMDSFKVASMSGVSAKDMFKLLLVGSLVASLVAIPLTFIELHAWGFMELPVAKEWDYFWDGDAGFYNGRLNIISPWGISGFLLVGILLFLRLRFAWWPLEPLGAMIGLTDFYPNHISTFSPLIVWGIKYAVLKVGGRKAYDEVGVPVALGIITGEITGIILVSIINIIRFFVFKSV
jgi:hypothetical protein